MKRIFLLLSFFIIGIVNVKADHYAGAEITYEYLGLSGANEEYLFTLTLYRDCSGEDFAESYPGWYITKCPSLDTVKVTYNAIEPAFDITTPNLCDNEKSRCTDESSLIPGRVRRRYQASVLLPPNCVDDYIFYWKRDYRNTIPVTNVNNGNQPLYVETTLNNSIVPGHTSISFSDNLMAHTICFSDTFRYDFGAETNVGGNSFATYQLIDPLTNAGSNLNYVGAFTGVNPITTSGGFNLNSVTGELEFEPQGGVLESSVIAVEICEFRKSDSTLIGCVTRDLQLALSNCNNNYPGISGVNNTSDDTAYFCLGSRQCFRVYGFDPDGDNEFLNFISRSDNRITYTSSGVGTQNSYAEICFTPDTADLGQTFSISIGISDLVCPVSLSGSKTLYITIPNDTLLQCQCSSLNFSYDNICLGSTTEFFSNPNLVIGGGATFWNWDFGDGSPISNLENPTHMYSSAGDYIVTLSAGNGACDKTISQTIHICSPPNVDFEIRDSCQATRPVNFVDQSSSDCNIFQWYRDLGDGTVHDFNTIPYSFSPYYTHQYADSGWYDITYAIQYGDINAPTKCYDTIKESIYIYPSPQFTLHPNNSFYQSCDPSYDTLFYVVLEDTSNTIQWYVNGALILEEDGGTNDTLFTNTFGLTHDTFNIRDINYNIHVEDSLGCYNDSARQIYDPIHPRYLNTPYCETGDTIKFWDITTIPDGIRHYDYHQRLWLFNDPNDPTDSDTSFYTEHFYSVDDIYTIDYYQQDKDSCFDYAKRPEIKVVLPDHYFNVASTTGGNDTICFDDQNVTFEGPNEDRATIDKYIWYIDDGGLDSIIIQNNYTNPVSWSSKVFGSHIGNSTTSFSSNVMHHTYDSTDFGLKYIRLKTIYNTIKDDNGALIDSLHCERNYFDTIDIRPPHRFDYIYQKECIYDTIQLTVAHDTIGDNIVFWHLDFQDSSFVAPFNIGGPVRLDTVYTYNDTFNFGSGDTISSEYKYTDYQKPDLGERYPEVFIIDEFGCDVNNSSDKYRVHKLDTLFIEPIGFCSGKVILFPPSTDNDFNNLGNVVWDFSDPITPLPDTTTLDINTAVNTTLTHTYSETGVYTVTVTGFGENNSCFISADTTIAIQPTPLAYLTQVDSTCLGEATLFKQSSTSYGIWEYDSVASINLDSTIYSYDSTGNFIDGELHIGDSIIPYSDFEDGIYSWTFDSLGVYDSIYFSIQSDNMCWDDTTISVYVAPTPVANFGFSPDYPSVGETVEFIDSVDWFGELPHLELGYGWYIYDKDGNQINLENYIGGDLDYYDYQFESEGLYTVELVAINEHNCKDTAIKELDTYAFLDFPDAFSPAEGGDEENDNFRLYYKGIKELLEYKIYNRFGELVFNGMDHGGLTAEWDGTINGSPQEMGSFVVIVKAIDVLDRSISNSKNLMLVR